MKQFAFPKTKRLISNRQFKAVLARNLRVANGLLTLFAAENECGYPRLGVSVGKSCGKAVVRNRLKRLIREAFRQNQHRIPAAFDYLVMVSAQAGEKTNKAADRMSILAHLTFDKIQTSLLGLVSSAVQKSTRNSRKRLGQT